MEEIRSAVFDTWVQQQLQIDLEFWKQAMYKFLSDDQVLYTLVQDIASCTQQRCSDVKTLDPKLLAKIVYAAMPKEKEEAEN